MNTIAKNCFLDSGCVEGFHGDYCSKVCPDNCINSTCLQENGHCTGCKFGYYNDHCDRSCPATCTEHACDQITGLCTGKVTTQTDSLNIPAVGIGSGCGVVILALVIVVIVLVRRPSREKSDTTTHVTNMSEVVRQQKNIANVTYDEIEDQTTNQKVQMETIEDNYEKLDIHKMESTHVYQTREPVL